MPVLKQYHTTPAMREAIVLDLGDIGAQAAKIRASAETQAQQIIAAAEAQAERTARELSSEAQESGYAAGLEAGQNEGRTQGHAEALAQAAEQLRQLTEAWSQVIGEWEAQRIEMEREARQSVLNFALVAAEKIVHRVIEIDESVIIDQVRHALSLVLSAQNATIRIHPVDRPILDDALPKVLAELSEIEHIELVEDEVITPGGCVVSFGQGTIDATIERQLGRLIDMILPAPAGYGDSPIDNQASAESIADHTSDADETAASIDTGAQIADEIAPVYEITEDGLVESTGMTGASSENLGDSNTELDETKPTDEPDTEV